MPHWFRKQDLWRSKLRSGYIYPDYYPIYTLVVYFSGIYGEFTINLDLEEQNVDFGNLFSFQLKSFLFSNFVIFTQIIYMYKYLQHEHLYSRN